MKSIFKRAALACLFVAATLCIMLFAACGGNGGENKDDSIVYTVTVKDDGDNPVQGAILYFSKGSARYDNLTTDADGKASITLAPDSYAVKLIASSLPAGYSAPDGITVTKDNPSVTVNLIKDFAYVVKLVDEEGKPFYKEGITIALCIPGGNCLTPSPLGAGGVWTMTDVDPADYKILINLPAEVAKDYTYDRYSDSADDKYYKELFTATKTEITITLKAVNAEKAYTINLIDPDGAPVKDVYVNLATSSSSLTPAQTGADGKAKIIVPSYGEYSVTVTPPEGFIYDSGIKTTATAHEITVSLLALNSLALENKMANADVTALGINVNSFDAHYLFDCEFAANQTKYFAFTAYRTGDYAIYCKVSAAEFRLCSEKTDFTHAAEYEASTSMANAIRGVRGNKVYFSAKAATAGRLQFVVAGPANNLSSEVALAEGTHSITVADANSYATITLKPTSTGKYELTSLGNFDTRVECYAGNGVKFAEYDGGGEGKNFKCTTIIEQLGTLGDVYRVYVKGDATFPATFEIKLTKTGEIDSDVNPEQQNVKAEQAKAPFDGKGAYSYVDLSAPQTVVLGEDGYYRLGVADGPVLVAKLTKAFRGFGAFVTVDPKPDPKPSGKATIPYYVIFKTYDDNGKTTGNYNYISFIEAYAPKCNFDGVYPVNAEIKLMLERWAAQNINEYTFGIDALGQIAKGNEWLIPCGYYSATELKGTGAQDDPFVFGESSYGVSIPKNEPVFFSSETGLNGKFTLTVLTAAVLDIKSLPLAPISVNKIEDGYAFDCEADNLTNIAFSITAADGAEITLCLNRRAGNELESGDNEITVSSADVFEGVAYTFIAAADGWYVISSADENAMVLAPIDPDDGNEYLYTGNPDAGDTYIEGAFNIKFQAVAGVEYTIILGTVSLDGGTYIVTISESSEN